MQIQGIDDFGFLKVKPKVGKEFTVHPDGNSFDIMKGLIALKDEERSGKIQKTIKVK